MKLSFLPLNLLSDLHFIHEKVCAAPVLETERCKNVKIFRPDQTRPVYQLLPLRVASDSNIIRTHEWENLWHVFVQYVFNCETKCFSLLMGVLFLQRALVFRKVAPDSFFCCLFGHESNLSATLNSAMRTEKTSSSTSEVPQCLRGQSSWMLQWPETSVSEQREFRPPLTALYWEPAYTHTHIHTSWIFNPKPADLETDREDNTDT